MDVRSNYPTPTDTTQPTAPPAPATGSAVGATVERFLPLAGVAFAVLTIVGTLTVDAFPDEATPVRQLVRYYAGHHAQVGRGGELMEYAGVFLGLFGAALWLRARAVHPALGAVALIGAAVATTQQVTENASYASLGQIGGLSTTTPEALQAWHFAGALGQVDIGVPLLLLAAGLVGVTGTTVPRWLGWAALVLAVGSFTPLAFFASLLFVLWALVAGIVLTVRRPDAGTTSASH